jgi:hypothetical protein
MLSSREAPRAALASPRRAGAEDLETIARDALARAKVEPGEADAKRIATNLGFKLLAMSRSPVEAKVRGRCIAFRWERGDQRRTQANVFLGLAMALAPRKASPAEVRRLAWLLAGQPRPSIATPPPWLNLVAGGQHVARTIEKQHAVY